MFKGLDISNLFLILCSITLLAMIGRSGLFQFLLNLVKGAIYVLVISVIVYMIMNYPDEMYAHANRFLAEMKEIVGGFLA